MGTQWTLCHAFGLVEYHECNFIQNHLQTIIWQKRNEEIHHCADKNPGVTNDLLMETIHGWICWRADHFLGQIVNRGFMGAWLAHLTGLLPWTDDPLMTSKAQGVKSFKLAGILLRITAITFLLFFIFYLGISKKNNHLTVNSAKWVISHWILSKGRKKKELFRGRVHWVIGLLLNCPPY